MSWNWFPSPPHPTKIAVLIALVHSLLATAIATHQSLVFGRISVNQRRDHVLLSAVLGYDATLYASSHKQPQRLVSFTWQTPTMLLGSSIMCLLVGIAIHVYSAAQTAGVWGPEAVMALCIG